MIYKFCSIHGVDTDAIDYDDYLCNNNDTPGGISGVENDCSSTVQYGINNISFIDTNGVIMMHLIYSYVALVKSLDTISSSSGRFFSVYQVNLHLYHLPQVIFTVHQVIMILFVSDMFLLLL